MAADFLEISSELIAYAHSQVVFAYFHKGQHKDIGVPLPSFLLYLKEQVGTESSMKIIEKLNEDSETFRRRFRKLQESKE